MRAVVFKKLALEQFEDWALINPKIHDKILSLITQSIETPYTGIGKPEALKHQLSGYWSRRINKEHRLVYKVTENEIVIISCKFHY